MTPLRTAFGTILCVALIAIAGACGDDGPADTGTAATTQAAPTAEAPRTSAATDAPPTTAPATDETPPPAAETTAVGVYFGSLQGEIVRQERMVDAREPLRGALQELVAGPGDPAFVAPLPAGTRLLGVSLEGGRALVDLSGEFESGYPSGGSAAELGVVAPIVRTALEVEGVETVLITVEGRVPEPVGAQFDFTEPLGPRDVG